MFTFEEIADGLRQRVAALDPDAYLGPDAARLTEVAAVIERLGATAKAMLARRAVGTNGWRRVSAASSEQWLASVSGSSETAAREALVTAERLDALPATAQKLRAGQLSVAQAAQVAAGAAVDPESEERLLQVADRKGMRELRADKERVIAAATDMDAAHALAVRERHVRTWVRGAATHGSFSGPTEEVSLVLEALEPGKKQAFDDTRAHDARESFDAYRFDALIDLARRAIDGTLITGKARSKPVARVRVDLAALLAGRAAPGEVCEVPGVGPVPVAHARQVLSHGLLELVITDGVDVQTVVSTTRHVPNALKIAIEERDQRCKVRGCDADHSLERHRVEAFKPNQITSYRVLGNLCPIHHDLITYKGYTVIQHPDGSWSLRAPPRSEAA